MAPDDREGFTPIALPGKQPVPQLVIDRSLPGLVLFQIFDDAALGLGSSHTVYKTGIFGNALARKAELLWFFALLIGMWRLDNKPDFELKFFCKLKIAFIMAGHSHDGACAVTDKHIVCNPYRDLLLVQRIDRKSSGENAGFISGKVGPLQIGF